MKAENNLGKLGLGMAVGGTLVGLFFLFAAGMSNVSDEAKRAVLIALPAPIVGFVLSIASLVAARRRGNLRACAPVSVSALVISTGMILLTLATWNSYR